ncbi:hypothetical protein [Actinoplanes couchii]|uniref:Fibronectin type-III domain-containing protein n=1 Tax=Actinoplanes couchii TaxID=403638 RepID=A0ABQ3X005_9ACTN|nr:hypothetical protein [Actinoplanes couchii]MDR6316179.1 hypothetical protein [Actinoplanes couchii]GID51794.1 hypothetical protein Aco03nite_001980 [Actinoplanes couchii]
MAFDPRTYLRDVVNPLRDRAGSLPGDLARHYAVGPGMSSTEITGQLVKVRSLWRRQSGGAGAAARVCARMITRDEQLRREHGDRMHDPAWWRERAEQDRRGAVAEGGRLADELREAYGPVGLISRDRLDAVARHYPALDRAAVGEALRRAGLTVAEPVALPADSSLDARAYRNLSDVLGKIGVPTVVHLLHPGLGTFTLLNGAPPLDRELLAERRAAANTAADAIGTRLRKEAYGILATALDTGADLRRLALFQLVDLLRRDRGDRPDSSLIRTAVDTGLDPAEARTLVFSLPAEQAADPAGRIRALVEDGRLLAARQALAALPAAHPENAELSDLVTRRLDEARALRDRSDQALHAGRESEAALMLRDAQRIAADDEDLERRLAALPPPPARDLVARPRDHGVVLSWTGPGPGPLRYRVVRGDTPPTTPGDGELVGEVDGTELTEELTEPGRPRHYAVFAGSGAGTWSRPVTVAITVLPPVSAVQVRAGPAEVFLSWQAHPRAERVRVRRTVGRRPAGDDDGEPIPGGAGGLYDRIPADGSDRWYSLVAVYRDAAGAEVTAPAVVVRAGAPTDAPPWAERLTVHLTPLDRGTATARITWATPAAGRVSVRRSERPPGWAAGDTVAEAEVLAWGEPLIAERLVQGPETRIEVTVPSGRQVYVPFTLDGSGTAVVGEPAAVGVVEPVRQLHARRTGDEITLTWVWPASVSLVEVVYTPDDGREVRRRMTRGQVADTGCRITAPVAGEIAVRAVLRGRGGDLMSLPETVPVDGVATVLHYHLPRVGGLFGQGRRLLRVTVDRVCEDVELHLVVAGGPAMPTRPEQSESLLRFTGLTLAPGDPWEVPFTVAKRPKPYWLRCFVVRPHGIRVVDPIDDMKVS